MFRGLYTALITPFKYGKLDEEAYINMIEWQIESGVHGLVSCGSTGESPTLTHEEQLRAIELCVQTTNKRIPVIAGTSSNSTSIAIELSMQAQTLGVDGLMLVTPYYNRPTQEGIYQHFKAVHDATSIPIIIYDNPKRAIEISIETIIRLAKLERVVSLKDSSENLARPIRLKSQIKEEFTILSGDDILSLALNAQGGVGCISVASNIAPALCAKVQNLWMEGNFQEALNLQKILTPLYDCLFCESNPVPVKFAASLIGLCDSEVRLPLVSLTEINKKLIKDAISTLEMKIKNYEQIENENCSPKS